MGFCTGVSYQKFVLWGFALIMRFVIWGFYSCKLQILSKKFWILYQTSVVGQECYADQIHLLMLLMLLILAIVTMLCVGSTQEETLGECWVTSRPFTGPLWIFVDPRVIHQVFPHSMHVYMLMSVKVLTKKVTCVYTYYTKMIWCLWGHFKPSESQILWLKTTRGPPVFLLLFFF